MTKKQQDVPRKGAVISTTTRISLNTEVIPGDYVYGSVRTHPLPLSSVEEFARVVREQVGDGAEELGSVDVSDYGLIYTISNTLREGLK